MIRNGAHCKNPTLTLDFDFCNEYIEIFDNDKLYEKCGKLSIKYI